MERWVATRPPTAATRGRLGKGYAPPPTKRPSDSFEGQLLPPKPVLAFSTRYTDGWSIKPCVKRRIKVPAESDTWNFTKGVGPSAQPVLMRHIAKDPGRFKPTWKTKRPKDAIPWDKERKEGDAKREARREVADSTRRRLLKEQHDYTGFNIINGEIYDGSRIRSRMGGKKMRPVTSPPPEKIAEMEQRAEERRASRRESLMAEGIVPGRRKSAVKDNFNPYY